LTAEGRKLARRSVLTSWYDPAKPNLLISDPKKFVDAFGLFYWYYRATSPSNKYKYNDPPPPTMHNEWISLFAYNRRTILTAFRGGAKTMKFGEEIPEFLMISRPYTPIQFTSSEESLSKSQVQEVARDLENNGRIIDDFDVQVPARRMRLRWAPGDGVIQLANYCSYQAKSSEQVQRGTKQLSIRPRVGILDDWEMDRKTRSPIMRQWAEEYLFRVFLPIFEPGAWFMWTNTLIAVNALAMVAQRGEDPRLKSWRCVRYDPTYIDSKGVERHWWPGRFGKKVLDAMKGGGDEEYIGIGEDYYAAEMLGQPGRSGKSAFGYERAKHGYWWSIDENGKLFLNVIRTGEKISYEDLRKRSVGITGVDLTVGLSKRSCPAGVVNARLDHDGSLYVLEVHNEKIPPGPTLDRAMAMGEFWGQDIIVIESTVMEHIAIDQLANESAERQAAGRYAPHIEPFKVQGGEAKAVRALKLVYRFVNGLIYFPVPKPNDENAAAIITTPAGPIAAYSFELEEQVSAYTHAGGGTRYVDLIDALVAVQYIAIRVSGGFFVTEAQRKTAFDYMRECRDAGTLFWPGSQNVDMDEFWRRERKLKDDMDGADQDFDMTMLSEGFEDSGYDGSVFAPMMEGL